MFFCTSTKSASRAVSLASFAAVPLVLAPMSVMAQSGQGSISGPHHRCERRHHRRRNGHDPPGRDGCEQHHQDLMDRAFTVSNPSIPGTYTVTGVAAGIQGTCHPEGHGERGRECRGEWAASARRIV